MRLTKAIISSSNLKRNYLTIRKKVNDRKIMAVVKADAYGHNVKFVVDTLNSLGPKKPEYFAVATVDEGVELRELGIKQPILIFDPVDKFQVNKLFVHSLIPSIFSKDHIKILLSERKKIKSTKKIWVHIKVDTGMNRLGIDHDKCIDFVKSISSMKEFLIDGIFTHLATSDEQNDSFARLQIKRFKSVLTSLQSNKITYGLAHAANSGAIIDYPDSYFDMVRPGISLYGYYPSLKTSESIKLYPVLSLVSKVSTVKSIKRNESVSYSRRYIAGKQTRIISVPIGYADGVPRNLSNKAKAIIKGKLYDQIGTVTMDRVMFEIGDDDINVNDEVILLGKSGPNKIDAWDWSKIINTIPYEITCGISKRVPRIIK